MNIHFSSKTNEWATPMEFFRELDKEFNFTLDPCATKENAKCKKFFTEKEDGLSKSWDGERVFMNPPYGREIGKWVKKASEIRGGGGGGLFIACSNRYKVFSPIYLSPGRNSVYQGKVKIWRKQKFCTIPEHDSDIQR